MPIYYRSDTRPPEEIFKHGFVPRKKLHNFGKDWWKYGIKFNSSDTTSEAEKSLVVCMTTNFRSALIFPTRFGEDEVYVYAISLPKALKAGGNQFGNAESHDHIDSQVFDLHSYQVSEAHANWNRNKERNVGFIAWSLHAYEAFTFIVEAKNIIYAIKCKRFDFFPDTAGRLIFSQDDRFTNLFDRAFKVNSLIYVNDNCTLDDRLSEKEMCIAYYKQLANGEYKTTSTSEGLAGMELPAPKQERLFFSICVLGILDQHLFRSL